MKNKALLISAVAVGCFVLGFSGYLYRQHVKADKGDHYVEPKVEDSVVYQYFPEAKYIETVEDEYLPYAYKLYEEGDYEIETSLDDAHILLIFLKAGVANVYEQNAKTAEAQSEELLAEQAKSKLEQYVDLQYDVVWDCTKQGVTNRFEMKEMKSGFETGAGGVVTYYADGTFVGLSIKERVVDNPDETVLLTTKEAFDCALEQTRIKRPEFYTDAIYAQSLVKLTVDRVSQVYVVQLSGMKKDSVDGQECEIPVVCYVTIDAVTGELRGLAATDY